MRVGILTFSAAHNFGAILQCYGLFKTVQSLGHDVKVIDYQPDYLTAYKPQFGWRQVISRHVSTLPSRIKTYRYWRKIYDGYENFKRDNILLTPPVFSANELTDVIKQFDTIVVGSDQIWNSRFNGNDNIWYSQPLKNVNWITYAASAGNVNVWVEKGGNLKNRLSNFKRISVRESELGLAIENITGNECPPTVLDPSLLVDTSEWAKWTNHRVIQKDYILTYQARESDDVFRIARELSRQLNCNEIIPLDFYGNVKRNGYSTKIANPEEFISLVANAKCVVTTSFHGTAFSIISGTPFYTLRLNDGADGRSDNLLNSIGLSSRMINHNATPIFSMIDYHDAHQKLNMLRGVSLDYLREALS